MEMNKLRDVRFNAVGSTRWVDMERLFEGRGGPMYCWCMLFRNMVPSYGRANSESKKEGMRKYADDGTPVGLLGYLDGEPVAWCSIAPIESYRNLRGRGYSSGDENPGDVWSIACFFIRRGFRRQGLTTKLIAAAIEYARGNGAKAVEAYPVDPTSPSYLFMGYVGTFEALGFQEVGMVGIRRHMMRLHL